MDNRGFMDRVFSFNPGSDIVADRENEFKRTMYKHAVTSGVALLVGATAVTFLLNELLQFLGTGTQATFLGGAFIGLAVVKAKDFGVYGKILLLTAAAYLLFELSLLQNLIDWFHYFNSDKIVKE